MTSPKITLITPPDIFQNDQLSLMMIDLSEEEQKLVTQWFSENLIHPINLYYYQSESNAPWLLYAHSVSSSVYINVDNWSSVTSYLGSYLLSKTNVYWSTTNTSVAEIFQHISYNRVNTVLEFLERVLSSGQTSDSSL